MSNALAIALFVGITLLFLLIRFAVHFAANKAEDAIRNGIVRRSEAANPPRAQRLADRYAPPVRENGRNGLG